MYKTNPTGGHTELSVGICDVVHFSVVVVIMLEIMSTVLRMYHADDDLESADAIPECVIGEDCVLLEEVLFRSPFTDRQVL